MEASGSGVQTRDVMRRTCAVELLRCRLFDSSFSSFSSSSSSSYLNERDRDRNRDKEEIYTKDDLGLGLKWNETAASSPLGRRNYTCIIPLKIKIKDSLPHVLHCDILYKFPF